MFTLSHFAAAAAILTCLGCNHENDRAPMTPASGTTLSSDPTAPSIDPSVGDTQPHTPNTSPGIPNNDSRSTTMPGSRGTHDGSPLPPDGSGETPPNGSGAPTETPNGAPVGGVH